MRRFRTTKPRVRLEENGRASLHGLSYRDLRSILTAASLYNTEALAVHVKAKVHVGGRVMKVGCTDCTFYLRRQWLLDTAKESLTAAIEKTNKGYGQPAALTTMARLLELRKQRAFMEMYRASHVGSEKTPSDGEST